MLTAVIAVGLTAFAITAWLLTIASHAKAGTDLANAKLDAVRTGLAAGAGAGAAVGLMLAFRRQHHQEISTALTDHDATQRRITELYTKAVEQLGSDKAPVRLGGLYALERLAQDNQQQRQTIVNVICAYLRMPFSPQPPGTTPAPRDSGITVPVDAETSPVPTGTADSWHQEKQVRLTAQRILSDHLRKPDPANPADNLSDRRFWDGIRLDLTGATLFDFSLHHGMIAEALFVGATFRGDASFNGATFRGDARFSRAIFSGDARFDGATFRGEAAFGGATFSGDAGFDGAALSNGAWFRKATFRGEAAFGGATFGSDAAFAEVTFSGGAAFERAIFSGDAWFGEAIFSSHADFTGAIFSSSVRFAGVTFSGGAWFGWAIFSGGARFGGAKFKKSAAIDFSGTRVRSSDGHTWPEGWQVRGDSKGKLTIIRANSTTSP